MTDPRQSSGEVSRWGGRAAAAAGLIVAAGIAALAAQADHYAAHGLTARWRTVQDGDVLVVARTVEHRLRFPNRYRSVSRYVEGWDFERWGIPDHIPELDAHLSGTLFVPEPRPLFVSGDSPNSVEVVVDGRDASDTAVAPGYHRIDVYWWGTTDEEARLRLRWSPVRSRGYTIPDAALTPEGGSITPLRLALWIATPLLCLFFGLGVFLAARARTLRSRTRRIAIVAGVAIMLLGGGLRTWDYEVMPEFSANADELFATWNGWSLLAQGRTRGWSLWHARYPERVEIETIRYFRDRPWHNVLPYLEHPPLTHLLVGAAAIAGGAKHYAHARLTHTRLVPIALNLVALAFLILIARRLDPTGPAAWMAAILYAVLPFIAIQARSIKEEALVVPLVLAATWFYLRYRQDGERARDVIVAGALLGLTTLAKVPGVVFVPALVLTLLVARRYRAAALAGLAGVAVASLLFVYAALIDWDLFFFATELQATVRGMNWNVFAAMFWTPQIDHDPIGAPWLLFLWIGWIASRFTGSRRTDPWIAIAPVVYLVTMALSSGNWHFGWYMMPIYPFLCLGAGRFLADLWEGPELVRGTLFVVLLVMYGMNFTLGVQEAIFMHNWPMIRERVYGFVLGGLAPFALAHAFPSRPTRGLARLAVLAGMAAFVVLGAMFVAQYDDHYEQYWHFDQNAFFNR